MDNHDEKEKDAEEMQRIAASEAPGDKRAEMAEKLVGNQHKLDVNKNGKIDGEDLKKLRGEEKEEDSEEEHPEPDADNMGGPSDHDADNKGEDEDEDEKPKMTGEQTIASVAATYAAMVNENVAGDPHAHNLTNKANELTALAHSSGSDTHHEDAQHAHHLAAEHYRVYAHQHHDPMVRGAANIHHEFHRSMYNHHMLHLVSADQDREASDAAAKHYGKKSVEEGTAADAEAGPEVMDPATQKMKDDADDETELKDGVPGAAQDGGDKVSPADKPAAANSSAALPKVKVITAPVTTNEDVRPIDAVDTDHLKALVHAANTASTLAHRLGSKKAHRHAANLHDLVHMHTAASSSDAENKMSHKHLAISKQHNDYADIHENAITNEGMTAIVTRKNSDGSYDEVGMSNKTVVRGSHSNILKKAKEYAKGPHRVELFHGDRIGHGSPHKVIHSE